MAATSATIELPAPIGTGQVGIRTGPFSAGLLWAATLFLSAALSFSIQPLYARMLLPRMGGTPAVWVVSLVFFQVALLLGYGYAHALSRLRSTHLQVLLHLGLLALAATRLPPALHPTTGVDAPALATIVALATGVGLPYLVLTGTAPLLQGWFARARTAGDPYVLYAASNGGSLAGLLVYPFVLEPLLGLTAQAAGWTGFYAISAVLVGICGLLAIRLTLPGRSADVAVANTPARERIAPWRLLRWVGLAALPTAWLGASTTYVSTTVAPIPLLWVLPLATYLLTLIVAFAPPASLRLASGGLPPDLVQIVGAVRLRPRLLAWLAVMAAALALATHAMEPAPIVILVHMTGLFAGAMVCHATLAADRPSASAATIYYLALAAGGALGGAFAAVVAPVVFDTLLEYPLVLAAFLATGLVRPLGASGLIRSAVAAVLALTLALVAGAGVAHWFLVPILLAAGVLLAFASVGRPTIAGAALLVVLVVAETSAIVPGYRQERVERSFFGVSRVLTASDGSQRVLLNGLISHGAQALDASRLADPQGYYTRSGPLGDVLRPQGSVLRPLGVERVGVVGLGAGSIACYADSAREVTFYEIDPTVIELAKDPSAFSYLDLCPPVRVIPGDGRLSLQQVPDGSHDVLVVDAYSGDSMPLHLLTREALALYRRVLAPDGVVALHLSNKFFDLEPLVAALAADAGLDARIREDGVGADQDADLVAHAPGWSPSVWAVIGEEAAVVNRLDRAAGWRPPRARPGVTAWTDDYANPLAVRR